MATGEFVSRQYAKLVSLTVPAAIRRRVASYTERQISLTVYVPYVQQLIRWMGDCIIKYKN